MMKKHSGFGLVGVLLIILIGGLVYFIYIQARNLQIDEPQDAIPTSTPYVMVASSPKASATPNATIQATPSQTPTPVATPSSIDEDSKGKKKPPFVGG